MLLDNDDDGRSFVAAGIAYCSEDGSNGRNDVAFIASLTNWMEETTVILQVIIVQTIKCIMATSWLRCPLFNI
jgi:hypothetical protein